MSTYGALIEHPTQQFLYRMITPAPNCPSSEVRFKYKEVVANHYKYRGVVDDHNSKRHDGGSGAGLSFESSWSTIRWENRVFAFLLDAYLGRKYFGAGGEETQHVFRQKLAFDLYLS
jgi:hypothetical protein